MEYCRYDVAVVATSIPSTTNDLHMIGMDVARNSQTPNGFRNEATLLTRRFGVYQHFFCPD